jgi:hypothetical protein
MLGRPWPAYASLDHEFLNGMPREGQGPSNRPKRIGRPGLHAGTGNCQSLYCDAATKQGENRMDTLRQLSPSTVRLEGL